MCECTPEIRTPFCGRGDCLPPASREPTESLFAANAEAAAQASLDRVWAQAVRQRMEGNKTDPMQAALNWAHNYAAKAQPRGSDSDADIAHLIVEQTKRIAELTIENGQLHIQLRRDEWPGLHQRAEQAEARETALREAVEGVLSRWDAVHRVEPANNAEAGMREGIRLCAEEMRRALSGEQGNRL